MNETLEQTIERQEKEIANLKKAINTISKKLVLVERMVRRTDDKNRQMTENVRIIHKKLGG